MSISTPSPNPNSTRNRGGVQASSVLADAHLFGGNDPFVTGITRRLDAVREGDVFVAFADEHDTLEDVQAAIEAGAAVVVSERMLPVFGVPQLVVDDARVAYAELCHALLGAPTAEIPVIGIAGTHGKTSTSLLLASILQTAGHTPSCFTDRLNIVGGELRSMPAATDAASIAHNLAEAVAAGSTHSVIETSEAVLRNKQLTGVTLDIACLTNLYADNVAGDSSPFESRRQMTQMLEHLAPHGVLVASADDPDCQRLLATFDGAAITFAQHRPAEIRGTVVEQHAGEQSFLLTIDGDTAVVRTKIVGSLHIDNCLAAAAIATSYGVELRDIVRGIEAINLLPGVMQRIAPTLDFATYLDGGNSPESLRACLAGVRPTTTGRLIAVVPGQSVATFTVAKAMSDQPIELAAWSSLPIFAREAIVQIVGGELAAKSLPQNVLVRLSAAAAAVLAAQAGDTIVIAGCRGRGISQTKFDESTLLEKVLCSIAHLRKLPAAA